MKEKIGEALHKLVHSYRAQIREAAAKSGISIPISHIRYLKCIYRIENCSATEISNMLGLDKSQVTRVLKELVNDGYVEKWQNPNNHRSQLLTLTQSGLLLLADLMALEGNTRESMTTGLSDKQIEDFIQTAEVMKKNLHVNNFCQNTLSEKHPNQQE